MQPIPDKDLDTIRDTFEFTDADHNGSVDFKEFSSLLQILAPESSVQQSAEAFSMIDTDADGQINYEEFVTWWKQVWWEY